MDGSFCGLIGTLVPFRDWGLGYRPVVRVKDKQKTA